MTENISSVITFDDSKKLFGNILGRILILPYLLTIISINIYLLLESVSFIALVMPYTSVLGLLIGINILVVYLIYNGIEVLARINYIVMVLVLMLVTYIPWISTLLPSALGY